MIRFAFNLMILAVLAVGGIWMFNMDSGQQVFKKIGGMWDEIATSVSRIAR